MENPFSLAGKTVLITGASSGIGAQCAIDCAKMGAKVILIARNEERLRCVRQKMPGDGHIIRTMDLIDISSMKDAVNEIVSLTGPISGVIHSAGISQVVPLKLIKEDTLTDTLKTNVYAALFLTKEICKVGNYDKTGTSIIFISSIMGLVGEAAKTVYSMTKGALQSGARSLSVELAPKKIRVNCIAPGAIETPINAHQPYMIDPEKRAALEAKHPLGLGRSTDISHACVFLLSDCSRWITGQTIAVDGGYTAL